MTAGSMRETVKALTSTFAAPSAPCPLPDELRETIQAFLDRYHDIEDNDSQRLHEDLVSLYQQHVATTPEKHAPFLSALRLLRPALTGEARWEEWWGLILQPVIEGTGHKRPTVEDAREIIQSLLIHDGEDDKDGQQAHISSHFLNKVLDAYLSRTRILCSSEDVVSSEDEAAAHELETVLVTFGRRKPKELLSALDHLFVQKARRIQALNLLSAFVRLQPPHLYLVLETSLIQHLEKCLLIDTSSTIIELALMVLIMFLPHIAGSLPADHHLPRLFLIYSRLLCWDKFTAPEEKSETNQPAEANEESSDDEEEDIPDQSWEQAVHSRDYPDRSPPTLIHYFTFLYGLFPLNFMSFVRKPRKILKSLNFPGADDFDLDQDLIHSRTEPYRRVHLLHPNMFTTTIDDELDENKWLKSDPADIVAECMDLCVAVSTTLDDPGPPPSSKLPDLPISPPPEGLPKEALLDDDGTTANESATSWRNAQSTMFAPSTTGQPDSLDVAAKPKSVKSSKSASPLLKNRDGMDSPTLPPLHELQKEDSLGTSLLPPHHLPTPPLRLGTFAHAITTGSNSPTQLDFQNQTMASLQREIMLLRNDLNFERYLKHQHLAHIGQLQRKHIKEATAEAETQNLINTNRTLKARLAKANEMYAQLKKETLTSRNQSKKWEGELSAKVRSYREEQKAWQSDEGSLRYELQKTQHDCAHLKNMVEKAESEQLKAQQRTRALEYELEEYGNVRRELEATQEKVLMLRDQSKEVDRLMQERNQLRNELEVVKMRLNSRELERERSVKAYERRILELEARLQATERSGGKSGQLSASMQQMLDSALAANNAKLQQIKKVHHRLLEKYTELEMKYHDLEGERQAEQGRLLTQEKFGHHGHNQQAPSRNFGLRHDDSYATKYPPLVSSQATPEDYDYYGQYSSPVSINSPNTPVSPARPVRLESLPSQRAGPEPIGLGQDFSAAYDASLDAHFQAPSTTDVNSSGKSTLSVETSSSKGDKKDKVVPKSEVRVYGRGGAQNIGKKVKEKEQKKAGSSKTGGFRGLKGIM